MTVGVSCRQQQFRRILSSLNTRSASPAQKGNGLSSLGHTVLASSRWTRQETFKISYPDAISHSPSVMTVYQSPRPSPRLLLSSMLTQAGQDGVLEALGIVSLHEDSAAENRSGKMAWQNRSRLSLLDPSLTADATRMTANLFCLRLWMVSNCSPGPCLN
jgi:hypothetical protein